MRLIDADAVEKITWEEPHYHDPFNVLTEVREKVRALPTIDAVPVIRCKDCIHHHGHDCENMNYRLTSDDFYCGWAEREEE